MCMQEIIDIFKGLLTPLIGVIAVYIAYQQYRTNRLREQRESRKAKLDVYKKVKRFLHDVDHNGAILVATYEEFGDAIAEADFLFPEDITDWLDELYVTASEWRNQEEGILKYLKDSELTREEFQTKYANDRSFVKVRQEMESYIDGLTRAHENLKQKFSKYLKVKK
jgi:hypothetical protein